MSASGEIANPHENPRRVCVLGGGISGLAAAWYLSRQPGINVRVLEASSRVGGVLETVYDQGYLIERSADNFATLIPDALELSREIGYESQLIRPRKTDRRAFVVHGGRLCPIPAGFSLMQPTRVLSMLTTPTLTWSGKFRLARELFVPARTDCEDESLESFATRRLGRETYENLVEPIVSGIFTANPATLSMQATLPQFVEMERRAGGLIRGHLSVRRRDAKQAARRASGARYDQFMAPQAGMSDWIEKLAQSLPTDCVVTGAPVQRVVLEPATRTWLVSTSQGQATYDGVVVALPASVTSRVLAEFNPELSRLVGGIPYASSAVVALVLDRAEIRGRLDGFGLIVPHKERRPTLAISYTSNKYPGRVPDDQILLRLFFGGAMAPERVDQTDDTLMALAEREVRELLGWTGTQPRWRTVVRWRNAMPQYLVGHVQRVEQMQRLLADTPTLQLCGAAYSGVGIPQCVRSARLACEQLLSSLEL